MTTSALPKVRYIKWEQLCIGDTVRISWTHGDVDKSETGTITEKDHDTASTSFYTASGYELIKVIRSYDYNRKITLLNREAPTTQGVLF